MKRFQGLTQWLGVLFVVIAGIVVYKTFDNFDNIWRFFGTVVNILSPFVLGFALAFLLHAPSRWIESRLLLINHRVVKKLARPVAIAAVYLLLLGIAAIAVSFILPALINGVIDFAKQIPSFFDNAMNLLHDFTKEGGLLSGMGITEKLKEMYDELYKTVVSQINVDTIVTSMKGVMAFTSSLFNVFMGLIISVYMLASKESLFASLRRLFGLFMKERWLDKGSEYLSKAAGIFYGYFYSQLLDACIVGVVLSIGLLIFGVPNAIFLGMLVGLMNMIPYFGAMIGGALCVLITLLSNGNIYSALGVAIYVIVMQQIDGNILQPRIVGGSIGVKPIYVLLAITIGGGFFGFMGILLGVPTIAVIQLLLQDYIAYREFKKGEEVN